MSSETFFGTPRKFCGMCGVVGIKGSPIIITYYFLFVNKRRKSAGSRVVAPRKELFLLLFVNERRNEENNDGGDGDIGLYWMGPGAPTLANSPTATDASMLPYRITIVTTILIYRHRCYYLLSTKL